MADHHPTLRAVALDTTDARRLAEFYRQLLGYEYRAGDEPPAVGEPDPKGQDWLVLSDPSGRIHLGIQQVESLPPSTWPDHEVPQQLHLDLTVPDVETLQAQRRRAEELGARLLEDRSADAEEPLYVLGDPAGHPFCIFVEPSG